METDVESVFWGKKQQFCENYYYCAALRSIGPKQSGEQKHEVLTFQWLNSDWENSLFPLLQLIF